MGWRYEPDYTPPPQYPWAQGPIQQIPIPPGVDPLKAMEFMDRIHRRSQKGKKEEKKDEKKHLGKELLWYFQAACILYFLSPPIAALHQLIATIATQAMK